MWESRNSKRGRQEKGKEKEGVTRQGEERRQDRDEEKGRKKEMSHGTRK